MNWLDNLAENEVLRYKGIIRDFKTVDVRDRSFNKRCNGYFHNRGKNLPLNKLQKYYELLENYKKSSTAPSYKTILKDINDQVGVFSPVLASQASHLFDNNLPVLSAPALRNSKVKKRYSNNLSINERIEKACETYAELQTQVYKFRDSELGKKIIGDFIEYFGKDMAKDISKTKIIDFYYWKK